MDECHLAEALTRPPDPERRHVADRSHDADGEAALNDEVERVAGIAAVEDDLALSEGAAAGGGHDAVDVLRGKPCEQRPFHAASLCRGGDIANVSAVNDAEAARAQTPPMFFLTPSSKEQTMKRIATTVVLVAVVALTLATVASAHRSMRAYHGISRPAAHAQNRHSRLQSRMTRMSRVGLHRAAY
jgi:hypothetical protein